MSSHSRAAEQVVFSGVAAMGSSFEDSSPVGFWIWCEAEADNSYAGECNGAMYIYALGITKHVDGTITENGEDTESYTMDVSSRDGELACTLTNPEEPDHGPDNRVDVTCSTPSGSAFTNSAVVVVTGR